MSTIVTPSPAEFPDVSVIVLAYNHEPYIRACLDSIRVLDYPNLEVIVLEDGSSDQTYLMAQRALSLFDVPCRLETQTNTGDISANSQKLLAMAKGKYTLLLSGDDLLVSGFPLRDMIEAMEADQGLVLCLPRAVHVVEAASDLSINIYTPEFRDLLRSGDPGRVQREHLHRAVSRLFLQGAVIRRTFYESFGGFDTDRIADDYGFMMRAFRSMSDTGATFRFFEDAYWIYRVHRANVHAQNQRQRRLVFEIVQEYVPPDRWSGFRFDHTEPPDLAGFLELRSELTAYFGEAARAALVPAAERRFYYMCLARKDLAAMAAVLRTSRHRLAGLAFILPRLYRLLL